MPNDQWIHGKEPRRLEHGDDDDGGGGVRPGIPERNQAKQAENQRRARRTMQSYQKAYRQPDFLLFKADCSTEQLNQRRSMSHYPDITRIPSASGPPKLPPRQISRPSSTLVNVRRHYLLCCLCVETPSLSKTAPGVGAGYSYAGALRGRTT